MDQSNWVITTRCFLRKKEMGEGGRKERKKTQKEGKEENKTEKKNLLICAVYYKGFQELTSCKYLQSQSSEFRSDYWPLTMTWVFWVLTKAFGQGIWWEFRTSSNQKDTCQLRSLYHILRSLTVSCSLYIPCWTLISHCPVFPSNLLRKVMKMTTGKMICTTFDTSICIKN